MEFGLCIEELILCWIFYFLYDIIKVNGRCFDIYKVDLSIFI